MFTYRVCGKNFLDPNNLSKVQTVQISLDTSQLLGQHYVHYAVHILLKMLSLQCAKKVVSDSPGHVDFAIGLVIFVLNLLDRQVLFFGEIQITEGLQSGQCKTQTVDCGLQTADQG